MVSKYDNKLKFCKMGLYGILGVFVLNIIILCVTYVIKNNNNGITIMLTFVNVCAAICSIYALVILIINMCIKSKLKDYEINDVNKLIHNQKLAIYNIRVSSIIIIVMFVLTWLV